MALVMGRNNAHLRNLQRFHIHLELSDALAEGRVFDQRLAVGAHLARRLAGELDPLLRLAEPGDPGAFMAEQKLCDIPAAVFLTDAPLHRYPSIVEKHLVQMMADV